MTEYVLDASALLAVWLEEKGADRVLAILQDAHMSSVNASECLVRMLEHGSSMEGTLFRLNALDLPIHPFDKELATMAASLSPVTRHLGLSFADRACLALGLKTGFKVFTADADMAKADIGLAIECIR